MGMLHGKCDEPTAHSTWETGVKTTLKHESKEALRMLDKMGLCSKCKNDEVATTLSSTHDCTIPTQNERG
jgi:hypothetical protein